MCRAIASSLSAKVFLLTAALLAVGCLALYVAVALALPGGYRALSAARAEEAAAALAAELSGADAGEAAGIVERFAAENGASVTLSGGTGAASAGEGAPEGSAYTVSVAVELADGSSELLTITDSSAGSSPTRSCASSRPPRPSSSRSPPPARGSAPASLRAPSSR